MDFTAQGIDELKWEESMKNKKTLITYLISFTISLALPIVILTSFFFGFVRDTMMELFSTQYTSRLESIQYAFDSQLDQMQKISYQIYESGDFSSYKVLQEPTAFLAIQETLSSYLYTNPNIAQIYFYHKDLPVLFSADGTRNFQYIREWEQQVFSGLEEPLPVYLQSVDSPCWIAEQNGQRLTYIIPLEKIQKECRSVLIFQLQPDWTGSVLDMSETDGYAAVQSLSSDILAASVPEVPEVFSSDTAMEHSPQGKAVLKDGWYYYAVPSSWSDLRYTMLIPGWKITAHMQTIEWQYFFCLCIVSLLGIVVISFSMKNTYLPVHRLAKLAGGFLKTSPPTQSEVGRVALAMNGLQEKNMLLEEQARRRRSQELLFAILNGKREADSEIRSLLTPQERSPLFRILLVEWNKEFVGNYLELLHSSLRDAQKTLFLHFVNSVDGITILLAQYEIASPGTIRQLCGELCEVLHRIDDASVCIVISGEFQNLNRMGEKYRQARYALFREKAEDRAAEIFFAEETAGNGDPVYPEKEFHALENALQTEQTDQARFIIRDLLPLVAGAKSEIKAYSISCELIRLLTQYTYPGGLEAFLRETGEIPMNRKQIMELITELSRNSLPESSEALPAGTWDNAEQSIRKIQSFVHEHYTDYDFSVNTIADHFGISVSGLSHRFKETCGVNISQYIIMQKTEKAKELLQDTEFSVSEISKLVGYGQTSSFIRSFKSIVGRTPGDYRNNYQKNRV